jgi:Tfp pilus assembly protein PilF
MRRNLIIALCLVVITAGVYTGLLGSSFIRLDDDEYVTRNPRVAAGLTGDGFAWAWTSFHAGNWHPLTWLSHMLDGELFGLDPAGHHATNLVLHLLNTLLLFCGLAYMTGSRWPSAFVAALFALHPLHVESVAWVSERKDLLSAFFGLSAIWCYAIWVRRGGAGRYLAIVALLALGLMAKPMLVTLPFVLLLLDYWPLGRIDPRAEDRGATLHRLIVEKLPLLALSAASSIVTVLAQRAGGAVSAVETVPLHLRAANALLSYGRYLGKMLWPDELSIFYPHPLLRGAGDWPVWPTVVSGLLLVVLTVVLLRSGRRYAVVGWLWYLGTLVPVIGLVQVGLQAMADRYTYLPLIGPFVVVAWAGVELHERLRTRGAARLFVPLAALIVVVACAATTHRQVGYWRDSIRLFEHAVRVAPGAATIHNNLGIELAVGGRGDKAIEQFRLALASVPDYPDACYNLGFALAGRGEYDEAIEHYEAALRLRPEHPLTHQQLGLALAHAGRPAEAVERFREAATLRPDWVAPLNSAAWMLATDPDPAVRDPEAALRLALRADELTGHRDPTVLDTLATAHAAAGQYDRARELTERALALGPPPGAVDAIRARLQLYRQNRPFVASP